jgi:hypothetical protein
MATTSPSGTPARKKTAKTAPATSSTKTKAVAKPAAPTPAKKAPTRTAAARKPRGDGNKGAHVDAERRRNYIEVAAYYIAERRGFVGGNEIDDWAEAEAEIDRLLTEGRLNG